MSATRDLWRHKHFDWYIEVLSNDDGLLTVRSTDIGLYAKNGEPFEMGIEQLKQCYRKAYL